MELQVIKPTKGYSYKFVPEEINQARELLKTHYGNGNMNGLLDNLLKNFIKDHKDKKIPNVNQGTLLK